MKAESLPRETILIGGWRVQGLFAAKAPQCDKACQTLPGKFLTLEPRYSACPLMPMDSHISQETILTVYQSVKLHFMGSKWCLQNAF